MKYEEKYPKSRIQDEPEFGIIKIDKDGECLVCHNLTLFISPDLEGWICSEECFKNYIPEKKILPGGKCYDLERI